MNELRWLVRLELDHGFFAPVPNPRHTPAETHASAIVTAAANRDVDMLVALVSTLKEPDVAGVDGRNSVLVQVGAMARGLHRHVCGGNR